MLLLQVWCIQRYFNNAKCDAVEMKTTREELFARMKGLSAFTKGNIVQDDYKSKLKNAAFAHYPSRIRTGSLIKIQGLGSKVERGPTR